MTVNDQQMRLSRCRSLLVVTLASLLLPLAGHAVDAISSTTQNVTRNAPLPKGSLRVNINTATLEELQTLPGIGPALAARIFSNRPYRTVGDLSRISGISSRQVRELQPFILLKGDTEPLAPSK